MKLGLHHDVIIIGGGPAGLTAAIYASREKLRTLLIEKAGIGGLMLWTEKIENYPGFPDPIDARELADSMKKQAEKFGAEFVKANVEKLEDLDGEIKVITDAGDFRCRSLIIATGSHPRKLGVKGEQLPGTSYCAVCDGPLYEDMDVFVVGSGDSAMIDALFLSKIARKVTIIVIHEKPKLDASGSLREMAFNTENIDFIWDSVAEEILGKDQVEGIRIRNIKTGQSSVLRGDAVFIKIGLLPNTEFLKGFIELTDKNFVKIYDERALTTSREGVFAAGDVREKLQLQVATAAADGATAVAAVKEYLEERTYLDRLFKEELSIFSFWISSDPSTSQGEFLGRIAKEFCGKIKILEVDIYKRKRIAERFEVNQVPTMLVLSKGHLLDRIVGKISYEELIEKLKRFV